MRNARLCAACLLVGMVLAELPVTATVANAASPPADFYVATNGRDHWSGRLAAPNDTATDGPFATLGRARDAVRAEKQTATKKDFVVLIRGGVHRLTAAVVFSLEDAAPQSGTITYAALSRRAADLQLGRPYSELASRA